MKGLIEHGMKNENKKNEWGALSGDIVNEHSHMH